MAATARKRALFDVRAFQAEQNEQRFADAYARATFSFLNSEITPFEFRAIAMDCGLDASEADAAVNRLLSSRDNLARFDNLAAAIRTRASA